MTDVTDIAWARTVVQIPTTPADELALVAQYHPDLRTAVARHPNAYPDLLDWLVTLGDPEVTQAVESRRSADSANALVLPASPAPSEPVYYQPAPIQPYQAQDPMAKSQVAAGILGIFLGSLGIHNFYLGRTGRGVAQLLITVLTLGFGAFVSGIWGLVEGILILTAQPGSDWSLDATGRPLRH